MLLYFSDSAHDEGIVEVYVGDAIGVSVQPLLVTSEVGTPFSCHLIQIVPAEVGGDGCVHARDDTVENTLLETGIVEFDGIQACRAFSLGNGRHNKMILCGPSPKDSPILY